jgi:large subunit ribosomal protein L29
MKPHEIRALSDPELRKKLDESYKELFNLRLRLATRQLTNTSELLKVKKRIARIKTIMRERELNAAQSL